MRVRPREKLGGKRKSTLWNHEYMKSTNNSANFQFCQMVVKATHEILHGTATDHNNYAMTTADALAAELHLLKQAQIVSFLEKLQALAACKAIHKQTLGLIRVGGRLRRAEGLDLYAMHPIVHDSQHPVTKLLIREYDDRLLHPGLK